MKIPNYLIERIRAVADILDVVSDYVRLKKSGRNYFGLCPFHQEKTPSFSVNPEKQIFHCFGCGKGGNVFTFLMEYEKLTFPEAVIRLAERYHIQIEYEEETREEKRLVNLLFEIHKLAKEVYIKNLHSPAGKTALDYLKSRGFLPATIKKFSLGYALQEGTQIARLLKDKGYSEQTILKSGLVIRSNDGRLFDRFRHRIIFPIDNRSGHTIAFAGRALSPDEPAKYINSPETEIYSKSFVLFGLTQASDAIRKKDSALVVEGYTDLMKLHQSGIENVVACSGTAFTNGHARILSRLADTIHLCYDGDEAGQKAALRAGMILLKQGVTVKTVLLPEKEDPDSFIAQHGLEKFRQALEEAPEYPEFMAQYNRNRLKTPGEKSSFIQEIASDLMEIQDVIIRSAIIKQLAAVLDIDEQAIIAAVRKKWRQKKNNAPRTPSESPPSLGASQKAEEDLLKILLMGPSQIKNFILTHLQPALITNPLLKKVLNLFKEHQAEIDIHHLIENSSSSEERNQLSRFLIDDNLPEQLPKLTCDCLASLENQVVNLEINELRQKLNQAEKKGQDTVPILEEISRLMRKRKEIQERYLHLEMELQQTTQ